MQYPNKGYMTVVDIDGVQKTVKLEPMNLRLNQIQEKLKGYFQIIPHTESVVFLVDENAINKNLPENSFFKGFYGNVCVINLIDLQ